MSGPNPLLQPANGHHRVLFENAIDGIFQSTVSGKIIAANPALARMLGYDSPAHLISTVSDIAEQLYAVPERRHDLRQRIEEQGFVQQFEVQARRKDGKMIWVSANAWVVRDEAGTILYYEGILEDITERKHAEALREGQSRLLEMITVGAPLDAVLTDLVRLIESESDHMLCSILLLDEDGVHLRHGAAPSLPASYTKAIDGACIGPCAGSCGTAAYRGEPVIVTDILQDPLWADWQELAGQYGLRACWSTPILSRERKVLGTFAMYYGDVRSPRPAEERLIALATHIAAIAIEGKRAEELYRLITDSSNDLIGLMNFESRVVFTSPSLRQMLGYDPAEICGLNVFDFIHPEDELATREKFAQALSGETVTFAHRARHADGTWRWLDGWGRVVQFRGQPHVLAVSRDVTERRQLEERLASAQKMEAIGQLAGGIAHDFNNLLTVITGYCELLRVALKGSPLLEKVEEISKSAERAGALTHQLLAFGRRQILQPKVLNLKDVLADMEKMLRRLVSEDIELIIRADSGLGTIRCDRGQIEQVIMNLVINASDAMPQGGALTLLAENASLDDNYTRLQAGLEPGPNVRLRVSDTGCGMDAATRAHIFEPFFTTKQQGKGTGLGLATVYGIVEQARGRIEVESEIGKGTTFWVYLPRSQEERSFQTQLADAARTYGSETILVVEDQGGLRGLMCNILENSGYRALAAQEGREALQLCAQHQGKIDLMITDVVMPGMGGRELRQALARLHPHIKVLYISGYTDKADDVAALVEPGQAFLQKPFHPKALLLKVREMFDTAAGEARSA